MQKRQTAGTMQWNLQTLPLKQHYLQWQNMAPGTPLECVNAIPTLDVTSVKNWDIVYMSAIQ